MYQILISDPVSDAGLERLRAIDGAEVHYLPEITRDELKRRLATADALVIRSGTQVDAELLEAAGDLKLIGRAGVGVDNVDVPTATRAGIVVMNTPGGNRFAVAELTLALMLASLRPIVPACESMRRGEWDRKAYAGRELRGKTVGLLGLGRIGHEVARRVAAFEAKVIGYDPQIPDDVITREGLIEPVDFDALLARADILSLHVPLVPSTRGLIGEAQLARMKRGAVLINCARGGVVDEDALLAALEAGQISSAATDVFAQEPPEDERLRSHPRLLVTPHIGASTREASEGVLIQLASQIDTFFTSGQIVNAVNAPLGDITQVKKYRALLLLAHRVGGLLAGLIRGGLSRLDVEVHHDELDPKLVLQNLLVGALSTLADEPVNLINARVVAKERGIATSVTSVDSAGGFREPLTFRARGRDEEWTVRGAVSLRQEPVITEVNGFGFEIVPEKTLLFIRNEDVPGVIGRIGTFLGEAGVNIAEMRLAKRADDPHAFSVIKLDGALDRDQFKAFERLAALRFVRMVDLSGLGD